MSPLKQLPAGWAWATLRELADLKGGITKGQRRSNGAKVRSVPYLRVANVQRGFLDLSEVKTIEAEEGEIADLLLRPGDILFNEGGDRDKLGRGWIWRGELPECIHQNHVFRARLRSSDLQPKLVSWYANFVGAAYFSDEGKQTTNLASINLTKLGEFPVPVPPVEEQDRIVAEVEKQFTRLDAGVAALKRVQAQLKRYRASVLKAACEGRLVPTEAELARREKRDYEPADKLLARILKERRARWEADQLAKMKAAGKLPKDDKWKAKYVEPSPPITSELASLPEGWVWARAEQLCDFITKGTTPSSDKLHAAGQVPFIKVYNLSPNGYLDFTVAPTFVDASVHTGELARSRVVPGDVLMNIVGPPLGKVAEVPNTYPEWNMNQAIAVFRPMPSLDRRFLAVCLRTESILAWAISRAKTTAGQVNLTLEICRDLPIPLAPLSEQQRIAGEAARHLSMIDFASSSLEANLAHSARLRQAVLKTAFEGSLVPQNPRDEPAPKLLERISATVENKPLPKQDRAKQTTAVPEMKATR